MELVYFTVAGIVLYLLSDWILDRIERARGARFPQRSLIFFIIILVLTMTTFQVIRALVGPPPDQRPAAPAAPSATPSPPQAPVAPIPPVH